MEDRELILLRHACIPLLTATLLTPLSINGTLVSLEARCRAAAFFIKPIFTNLSICAMPRIVDRIRDWKSKSKAAAFYKSPLRANGAVHS
jgi:hypothetical protein